MKRVNFLGVISGVQIGKKLVCRAYGKLEDLGQEVGGTVDCVQRQIFHCYLLCNTKARQIITTLSARSPTHVFVEMVTYPDS